MQTMSRVRRGAAAVVMIGATTAAACGISTQQEIEMGTQYARQINSELPIVDDAAANRYINALGQELAAQSRRQQIGYRFYIVNSDVVNAFAVPGGYIYINRGLIEATDDMSELAGVMAHEIAHVEERHSVEQLERAQGANLGLTLAYVLLGRQPSGAERALIDVGGGLYFASHSRDAEREADAVAVPMLVDAGITPNGLVTFFQELLSQQNSSPGAVGQWFSTHPTTQERIEDVRAMIAQQPSSRLRGLQTTSNAYQNFKANLRRYPAPPR